MRGLQALLFGLLACNSPSQPSQAAVPKPASPDAPSKGPAGSPKPAADAAAVGAGARAQASPAVVGKAQGSAQQPDAKPRPAKTSADNAPLAAAGNKKAEKPPEDKAKPGRKKVLIMGDSLVATAIGVLLQKELDGHPQIDCARKAKSATGLARPDFYNWMSEARTQVRKHKPDLVVMVIGGNDGQDLRKAGKSKERVKWKGKNWEASYEKRVVDFIDIVRASNSAGQTRVLWLGLPRTATKGFEKKLETIRATQKRAIASRSEHATYRETTSLVTDKRGAVLKNVRFRGKNGKLRERDGIHFTMHGSRYFAHRLFPLVLNELGLKPVQAK